MTIDASKLEGWASAMQVAKNGLGWYRNEFPETYSTSDDKAHAQLDEALASMAEELKVARGEVMVNGLTGAETSASASVAGLTCGKDHAADVASASADDMKVYDGIAAGYHRSIRQDWPPLGPGQALDPEIVNKIAAQAGFGPAAAWPEFSSVIRRFFNIAFRMGAQSATSAPGRT